MADGDGRADSAGGGGEEGMASGGRSRPMGGWKGKIPNLCTAPLSFRRARSPWGDVPGARA